MDRTTKKKFLVFLDVFSVKIFLLQQQTNQNREAIFYEKHRKKKSDNCGAESSEGCKLSSKRTGPSNILENHRPTRDQNPKRNQKVSCESH